MGDIEGLWRRRFFGGGSCVRPREPALAATGPAPCPADLLLAGVVLSHGISATTTRPSVSSSPFVSPGGLYKRPCDDETFPAWDTVHSLDAATRVPEQAPTALARCLHRCPSAFAHAGMGSAARLTTTRFSWLAMSTLQCSRSAAASSFARPPDGSDRRRRPQGLSSELAPSSVSQLPGASQ
jgi:hypothetical protein